MGLYIVTLCVIISMALVLIRACSGPTLYDRVLATNAFGTKIMVLIALISLLLDEPMLLDIALVYAMINFIATIGFLKYIAYNDLGKE